jgi:hypothetical protein
MTRTVNQFYKIIYFVPLIACLLAIVGMFSAFFLGYYLFTVDYFSPVAFFGAPASYFVAWLAHDRDGLHLLNILWAPTIIVYLLLLFFGLTHLFGS